MKLRSVLERGDFRAAVGVYALSTAVFLAFAPPGLVREHTAFNHFALLAESWLDGRLDLASVPAHAQNNDFALFEGRTYVVFPPLPAVLLVPWVALCGSAEAVPDGLVFALLSGLSPSFLLLALERLRALARSSLALRDNALLALCFSLGSVYFVTAIQGTVWFAAHVVGTLFSAAYLWVALGARRPVLAGTLLALAFAARAPLIFAFPLFLIEAFRAAAPSDAPCVLVRPLDFLRALDRRTLARSLTGFGLPLVLVLALVFWHNHARFGEPFEFGYRYLTIVWRERIERWGLFSYHYLPRNLGVMLTALPWIPGSNGAPFQINHHGLALWFTTPLYLALFGLAGRCRAHAGLVLAAVLVALPSAFYQNTGWLQFGYRFSNDYAVFLFALLAVSGVRLRGVWLAAALFGFAVNAFGASSFDRAKYARYYFTDRTQQILYQPD